ncbi:hypothetical protein BGZ54_000573 [Gamsiella multidivaricata]|nr:hypothetical protein BGZ54_000573 [Gamsiella multidivaricata]
MGPPGTRRFTNSLVQEFYASIPEHAKTQRQLASLSNKQQLNRANDTGVVSNLVITEAVSTSEAASEAASEGRSKDPESTYDPSSSLKVVGKDTPQQQQQKGSTEPAVNTSTTMKPIPRKLFKAIKKKLQKRERRRLNAIETRRQRAIP